MHRKYSCFWHQLHVFTLSYDWPIVLLVSMVIGK